MASDWRKFVDHWIEQGFTLERGGKHPYLWRADVGRIVISGTASDPVHQEPRRHDPAPDPSSQQRVRTAQAGPLATGLGPARPGHHLVWHLPTPRFPWHAPSPALLKNCRTPPTAFHIGSCDA